MNSDPYIEGILFYHQRAENYNLCLPLQIYDLNKIPLFLRLSAYVLGHTFSCFFFPVYQVNHATL